MIRLECDRKVIFVVDENDLDELEKECKVLMEGGLDKEAAISEVLRI